MSRRSFTPLLLSLALAAPPLGAAEPAPAKAGVRAVAQVTALDLDVVATKGGQPVTDLTKDEFVVSVDGKPLPVDYFVRVDAGTLHGPDLATASPDLILETLKNDAGDRFLPRQFLIVFDDDRLLPFQRKPVIEALRDFVTRLSPSDRASLVSLNGSSRVLVPYTSSKEDLLAGFIALEKIAPRGMIVQADFQNTVLELRRSRSYNREPIIRNWSAQALARDKGGLDDLRRSVAALAGRQGKRSLLFVSNGFELHPGSTLVQALGTSQLQQFDYSVLDDLQAVITEANRSGITIHAFDAKGLTTEADADQMLPSPINPFIGRTALRETLAMMSQETGGSLVENRNVFKDDVDRVWREASTYYSVGVTLASVDPKKPQHKVSVKVTRPGVTVRTRSGFGAKSADDAARDRMEMALMTPDVQGDFPAQLKIGTPVKGGGFGSRLAPYEVAVPLSELTFTDEGGAKKAIVDITIAAAEDTGARSEIRPERKTVSIPAARWEEAKGESTLFTGQLKTGKGSLRFIAAVRDVASGRIAIAQAPVRIE